MKNEPDYLPADEGSDAKRSIETEKELLLQDLQVHQFELETQNDKLRLSNEVLESQRIKLSGIYDLAPVGYFILNAASGKVAEVNNEGLRMLNTERSAVVSGSMKRWIAQEDAHDFASFLERLCKRDGSDRCQVKLVSYTKKVRYVQIEGICVDNVEPSERQFYMAVIDITEKKENEDRLKETKERLELALSASLAGTWEYSLSTGKLYFDSQSCRILGIEEPFNGDYEAFIKLVMPPDNVLVDNLFRNAINRDQELYAEFQILAKGKLCYLSIQGYLMPHYLHSHRFVGIIMDITDRRLLKENFLKLKLQQHKQITAAILEAQEAERKRISEALHDSVSQLLYAIKLNLQLIKPDADTARSLKIVTDLLNQAVEESRRIAFELAPAILTDFGLPATLQELARRLSTPNLRVTTAITGLKKRLHISVETSVYRIIQELLNNAIKHAEASSIHVSIAGAAQIIHITVKDNGRGFDIAKVACIPCGSGFSSIKNRLSLYNGTMSVDSAPQKGTSIHVKLYFDSAAGKNS